MNQRKAWDALQTRWASGEPLSLEEEHARRAYAERDPLARRELEIFAALKASVHSAAAPRATELAGRALRAARGSPLRLVTNGERPHRTEGQAHPHGRFRLRAGALAACVALGLGVWMMRSERGQRPVPSAAPPVSSAGPLRARLAAVRSELVFASGRVLVGEAARPFGAATLSQGERLGTEAGHACFTIDPAIDVCLGTRTKVVLESLVAERIVIRVERGTVAASLTKRTDGHVFALAGGDVLATAHGTVYALEHEPDANSRRVSVLEGSVAVSRGTASPELVPAHTRLTLEGDASVRESVIGRSEEARLLALLAPRELWQGNRLGVIEIAAGSPGMSALIDGKGPFGLPLSAFASTGEHRVALRSARGEESLVPASVELGVTRRIEPSPPAAPSQTSVPSPAALLEKARAQWAAGDLRGARALYLKLRSTHPQSPEATTVLVTLGRLELELGAPSKALRAFESYLQQGRPLAPEALAGKIQALRALARSAEERAAIQQYLSRYGDGLAAPALRKRLAELGGS